MTTTSEIVTRALRKIEVASSDEDPSAEILDEGLAALNAMMHAWKLQGVDLSHTNLALDDTFSLDPEYEEGTVYLLASRLSPDYTRPANFDADAWFRAFQAAYATIDEVSMPSLLINTTTQRDSRI